MKIFYTKYIPEYIIFCVNMIFLFCSCNNKINPQINDQAVNTPDIYSENKVVFLNKSKNDTTNPRTRHLLYTYQVEHDSKSEIRSLDPIGCVVRGVRIPETTQELLDDKKYKKFVGLDIAVVLDIVTAGSESLTSLVVFYQRNVKPGQMLNFQDLLVYYDPEWDGVTPPYFRIRVLDVRSERNQRTRLLLDRVENLAGSLNGIIPHPVLPAVQTGIQAAKEIFGNSNNKILIDYQVQFYSQTQIEGSLAKLTPLRKGEWLVLGREKNSSSSFWNNNFILDQQTGYVLNDSIVKHIPYVLMTLFSADASIPKHIMDRSKILIELLSSSSERSNIDALFQSTNALKNSVEVYALERRFKKYGSLSDLIEIIKVIQNNETKVETEKISVEQIRALYRIVNKISDNNFSSVKNLTDWWNTRGNGYIEIVDKSNQYPYGYKYIPGFK